MSFGVIIQLNLIFNDSSPVKSATAFLNSMSSKAPAAQEQEKTGQQPDKEKDTSSNPSAPQETRIPKQQHPAKPEKSPANAATSPAMPAVGKMIAKISQKRPTVYLTFDDGPGKYTKDIVNILDEHQLKGAFFWIGENLKSDEHIALAKQMIANGHIIGTHTMHHQPLRKKPKDEQVQMIRESTQYISQKIGAPIFYFRPPYGAVDQNTMLASKETNQILTYWNVDSLDWKYGKRPDLIMNNIASEVKPGSIILMHEKEQTVKLLPKIIELLKNKGYQIAPLPSPSPEPGKKAE
ncbi:hypothetical protein ACH33_13265 [Aneurinibacillus sp. XH2]|nr:hypothetical protein ACH33_13265 [Aneurinibacillus sp. XH2]